MWIVKLALDRPYTFVVMAILILILGISSIRTFPRARCGKPPPQMTRWNRAMRGEILSQSRRQTIPGREIALCKRSEIVKNADSQPDIASGTPGTIQARNLYATTRNGGASDSVNASISSKVDLGSVRINDRPASVAYVNQRRHVFAPCSLQVTQVTS